ncbi:MAG: CvpA family protein [Spirochaetaceae bacterium]|nr:MAG: CvpA family protein [Spirochaetaceae bacterium]
MDFVAIDIVFTIILLFTTLRAALRGFVQEVLSAAAVILGIAAAVLFSGLVAELLEATFGRSIWSQVVAFLAIFLVVYLVVKLSERALRNLVEQIHLESLDHALGLFLGLVEGILIVFVLILLIQVQPVLSPSRVLDGSVFARFLVPFFPYASQFFSRRVGHV